MDQQDHKDSKMSRSITLGQAIGFLITIISFIGTFYMSTQTRLTVLELKMENSNIDRDRIENKIDKMNQKMDESNDNVNEIKLILKDKADKK